MNTMIVASLNTATAPFSILAEEPRHVAQREAVLDRAMGEGRRRKSSEKLRRGRLPAEGLAFVAEDNEGNLIGTVRLWNVLAGVDAQGKPIEALLLGPLAVEPGIKSKGIGSTLMQVAVAEAGRLGHGAVLLVGDPEYYQRFGFTSAKTDALSMPGPYEKRRFLAVELKVNHLDGAKGILKANGRKAPRQSVVLKKTA